MKEKMCRRSPHITLCALWNWNKWIEFIQNHIQTLWKHNTFLKKYIKSNLGAYCSFTRPAWCVLSVVLKPRAGDHMGGVYHSVWFSCCLQGGTGEESPALIPLPSTAVIQVNWKQIKIVPRCLKVMHVTYLGKKSLKDQTSQLFSSA